MHAAIGMSNFSPNRLVLLLVVLVSVYAAKESSENAATLYSTAGLHSTMPTGNIPEAPELGTRCYNGQNVGSQWCLLWRGSTVVTGL